MAIETIKWRPRGPSLFAERDETKTPAAPKAFGETHCLDQVSLALNIDYLTHDAKCSGVDAEDARDIKKVAGEATLDFSNYTREALILALNAGEIVAEAAPVTETDEELPEVVEGDTVILGGADPNFNITAFSIEDSASVPATLTVDTDYTLDAKFGMLLLGDVSGFTQPLKASYTHQNPRIMAALAAGRLVRWIRFKGSNIVNSNKLAAVDFFKCQFSPTSGFDLLPDDYGKLSLKVAVQQDLSRESDDPRGQFFAAAIAA